MTMMIRMISDIYWKLNTILYTFNINYSIESSLKYHAQFYTLFTSKEKDVQKMSNNFTKAN